MLGNRPLKLQFSGLSNITQNDLTDSSYQVILAETKKQIKRTPFAAK